MYVLKERKGKSIVGNKEAISAVVLVASVIQVVQLADSVTSRFYEAFTALFYFTEIFGISGLAIWGFGRRVIWRMQAQALGSLDDRNAIAFNC